MLAKLLKSASMVSDKDEIMDSEKLLRVLQDIVAQEEKNNLADLLMNLGTQVTQNTQESYELAEQTKATVLQLMSSDVTHAYPPSYQSILNSLEITKYVGANATSTLTSMYEAGPVDLGGRIQRWAEEYRAQIEKCRQSISALVALNIKAYESKEYEVGYILPSSLSNLQEVTEHVSRWERFLVKCYEISGEEKPVIELTRMSNGSWQVFAQSTLAVAGIVELVLEHIVDLYGLIQKVKKICQDIESLEDDDEQKEVAVAQLQEKIINKQDTFLALTAEEVTKKYFKAEPETRQTLQNELSVFLKQLLKDTEIGIKMEVDPPTTKDPDDETTPSTESSVIKKISANNVELKALYSEPIENLKLPFKIQLTKSDLDAASKSAQTTKKKVSSKTPQKNKKKQ